MKVKVLASLEGQRRLEQASDSPNVTTKELSAYRQADFPDLSESAAQI